MLKFIITINGNIKFGYKYIAKIADFLYSVIIFTFNTDGIHLHIPSEIFWYMLR